MGNYITRSNDLVSNTETPTPSESGHNAIHGASNQSLDQYFQEFLSTPTEDESSQSSLYRFGDRLPSNVLEATDLFGGISFANLDSSSSNKKTIQNDKSRLSLKSKAFDSYKDMRGAEMEPSQSYDFPESKNNHTHYDWPGENTSALSEDSDVNYQKESDTPRQAFKTGMVLGTMQAGAEHIEKGLAVVADKMQGSEAPVVSKKLQKGYRKGYRMNKDFCSTNNHIS